MAGGGDPLGAQDAQASVPPEVFAQMDPQQKRAFAAKAAKMQEASQANQGDAFAAIAQLLGRSALPGTATMSKRYGQLFGLSGPELPPPSQGGQI